jgi:hypothetical protein
MAATRSDLRKREWLLAVLFYGAHVGVLGVFWQYFFSDKPWPAVSLVVPTLVSVGLYFWLRNVCAQLAATGQRRTARTYYWWSILWAFCAQIAVAVIASTLSHGQTDEIGNVLAGALFLYVANGIVVAGVELLAIQLQDFGKAVRSLSPYWRRMLYLCWAIAAVGLSAFLYGSYAVNARYFYSGLLILIADNVLGAAIFRHMQPYGLGGKQQLSKKSIFVAATLLVMLLAGFGYFHHLSH